MLQQIDSSGGLSIAGESPVVVDDVLELLADDLGELGSSPITREIIEAMIQSNRKHIFHIPKKLHENILFRLHAISAMTCCNTGRYDMDYYSATTGPESRMGSTGASRVSKYWEFLHPKVTDDDWEFSQTPNSVASEAIDPVFDATFPFRGECAGAFQMAVYFGLLKGLGADHFDKMASRFGTMYVGPWRLASGAPNPATLYMQLAPLEDPPIPGDYMYFKNKDDYLKWAPDGFWTGLNAMYMGKDALGTRHYSGMGASWLSETNLRASLVNAYYHDCSPHTISDPVTEVRFTERALLTIPDSFEQKMPDREITRSSGIFNRPNATQLKGAGFSEKTPGVFSHAGETLGTLADKLGFDINDLRQVKSGSFENPPHHIAQNGMSVIVQYEGGNIGRHDANAWVTADANLDVENKG